jgi:hypothetical protein
MNIQQLIGELKRLDVNPRSYSIGKMTQLGEDYTVLQVNDGWEVFYNERGNKNTLKVFDTEDEACRAFLQIVLEDPTTRKK